MFRNCPHTYCIWRKVCSHATPTHTRTHTRSLSLLNNQKTSSHSPAMYRGDTLVREVSISRIIRVHLSTLGKALSSYFAGCHTTRGCLQKTSLHGHENVVMLCRMRLSSLEHRVAARVASRRGSLIHTRVVTHSLHTSENISPVTKEWSCYAG